MSKVLTFILIIYLVYRLARFFFRPLLVFLAKRAIKNSQSRPDNSGQSQKREGSIKVDHIPPKENQMASFKGGEYVDYEELDRR